MRSPRVEFALSLGFSYEDGQTFIFDNLATPFSIGRTSIIKFGQDYIKREPQRAWFLRRRSPPQASQFSFGIHILDATMNNHPIPDGRFFSWLGEVQRVQHLLFIQADLQLTPDSLLSSQQFVIGGGQSIRGYRQNIRSGDDGFRVTIKDRITVQRNESGLSTIQLAPFLDMGAVWNKSNSPNPLPDQTFLLGAGLGLLWNQAMGIDNLYLRLDYGFPFIDLSDRGNNAQDDGFYFSLRYQLSKVVR